MSSLSLPTFYLSAPTSPGGCSPQNLRFYSTMSSPLHHAGEQKTTKFDFDFGSSRSLADGWEPSISTMAFADELFCNGKVLPLKLPPRLQRSVPTSPMALRSRSRNPFRCTWNDDFDPFVMALEKVTEEPSGRMSVHRRSRSYSPFRARNISRTIDSDQKESPNRSKTGRTMVKKLWIGKRVRDFDLGNEPVKPMKNPTESITCTESKMHRVKSVLLRYASQKKESVQTNDKREITTMLKVSYFKRLSLSLKTNRRKKEPMESKMCIKDKLLQKITDRIGIPKFL